MLPRDQLRQITSFLLVRAVAADLIDAKIGMGAVGKPDRSGRARDFLHRDAMLEISQPRPAPLLLNGDPVHAEFAELGPQVARKGVAAVDFLGARRDARSRESAHAVAQGVGRLAQPEVEAAKVVHAHARLESRLPLRIKVASGLMHVLDRAGNITGAAA